MEEAGHELCFISHPSHNRRIRCNVLGGLSTIDAWGGWEAWRFIKVKGDESGNFIITSWTHDNKVLCSNEEGKVFTADKKKLEDDGELKNEEWKITLHPESRGIMIRSVKHNRCLAFNGKDLYTNDHMKDTACHSSWYLEPAHRNQFFISSICHDKRLSSTKDDKLGTNQNRKVSEQWVIEPTEDNIGQFTIRSLDYDKYLSSLEDGTPVVGESKQCWRIDVSRHGGVFIHRLAGNGGWLSCNVNGHPCTSNSNASSETWSLEPIMPSSMNSTQFWTRVGIGAAAMTTAVAAPFAVMGAVGAMGYSSGGIVSGSIAAGMMSAEAIAGGGAVAAGGTVATLSSIGASGLGVAGASAAAGAGAVVGGGLSSLCVVTGSKGSGQEGEKINLEEPEKHLPLCSWRLWKENREQVSRM